MDDAGPVCPLGPKGEVSPSNFAEFRRELDAPEAVKWKLGSNHDRPAFAAAHIGEGELAIVDIQVRERACECGRCNAVVSRGIEDRQSLSMQFSAGIVTSGVGAVRISKGCAGSGAGSPATVGALMKARLNVPRKPWLLSDRKRRCHEWRIAPRTPWHRSNEPIGGEAAKVD